MNKILLHSITFFLLTIFVSLKVVNTHYFVHVFDETETLINCEICNDFQSNTQTDLIPPIEEDLDFKIFQIIDQKELNNFYSYQSQNNPPGCHFNKPPPTLA